MASLHQLNDVVDAAGDVVFIHGIDGNAFDTWALRSPDSWVTWLNAARPDLRVWTVGYDAASSAWLGSAMPLTDRAVNVLAALYSAGLGSKPICFVTHSMGGLVVKQLLREAISTSNEYRPIAHAVKGIVFLSTPHTGSDVASLAQYLAVVLRLTEALRELESHAPVLRDLNRWFRNNAGASGWKVKVFFETHSYRGVLVVNPSSADPGLENVTPIPIDADHVSICKPLKPSDLVASTTLRFIDDVLPVKAPEVLDPLPQIRRDVLMAQGLTDLLRQQDTLKIFLSQNPPTPEALSLQREINKAIKSEQMMDQWDAPPSYEHGARREVHAPSAWQVIALGILGVLVSATVLWKIAQFIFREVTSLFK